MRSGRKTTRRSLIAAALLLPLAWPVVGSADGPRTRAADFIGLWAGIDLDDGSFAQRAITCDEDRTCRVLGSDQFFSFCDDHGGRGILDGTGTLENGVIEVPDYALICGDGTRLILPAMFHLTHRAHPDAVQRRDSPTLMITPGGAAAEAAPRRDVDCSGQQM